MDGHIICAVEPCRAGQYQDAQDAWVFGAAHCRRGRRQHWIFILCRLERMGRHAGRRQNQPDFPAYVRTFDSTGISEPATAGLAQATYADWNIFHDGAGSFARI